ncbi:MAG TPA: S41 family peptidase, partial [Acholeplasmataceae bacterium]|nr:S41 family peptidase [Acholeplasmataceae bacterium]
HAGGYYTKTINEVPYIVTVAYSNVYSTAYIGLTTTIPATYDAEWKITNDIVGLIESDSAVYLETMIKEVKEAYPNVTKLGIDLTFNTGGNVGALYRVLGLITDQPFATSGFNRDTYSYSTTYITTSYESYTEFDWFLLTSFATFSAANEMATMFKQNNMGIIIGEVSGGGACSITPILLPDGTFFTMSSNNINMLRLSDGTYVINEDGITPDHVIPQIDLLNNTVLAGILNGN